MKRLIKFRTRAPRGKRQKGMATILIVLMVGLAVSVTVAASMYALRGDQERQLTTHSVTSAQAAAWRGVEVLRRYLVAVDKATYEGWATGAGALALPSSVTGMADLGIPDGSANITALKAVGGGYEVAATITAYAGSGSTSTSATVEVVYDVAPGSGGSPGTPVCATIPVAPMVFNGNLDITGGSLSVTNPASYENIAVAGNITLGSSSQARISGCAKGNVTLSGGGISNGGHIHSEGTIFVNQMNNPTNTTLWGRDINIGSGVGGGKYTAVKAGAYATVVYSDGVRVGTADVGGRLIAATVSGGLPWTFGTVLPLSGGKNVITLDSGATYLVDFSRVSIDQATGEVSAIEGAQRLSGDADLLLPATLSFRSTAIAGGSVQLSTLTIDQLWGHSVVASGYSGTYGEVRANGHFNIGTGTITSLIGGGNVNASVAGLYWNFPTVTRGSIAGQLTYGNGNQPVPNPKDGIRGLDTSVVGTTPGLPGIPFCDTRTNVVDADRYRDLANYVFEWANGAPQLTIRNVRTITGVSIDGVYNLATDDVRLMPGATDGFLTCNWKEPTIDGSRCFTDKTERGAWVANGLTHFPRGVVWFDNEVTIDGTGLNDPDGNRDLLSTIVAKGYVTLTQAGHGRLLAPNLSTPARICNGQFQPINLCDKTVNPPLFAEWEDAEGLPHRGLPIANVALATESGAQLSGWEIHGNVLLGETLGTAANSTVIHGSLTVGANQPGSTTTIQQGGAEVVVKPGGDTDYVPGICEAPPTSPVGSVTATVRWSRYR